MDGVDPDGTNEKLKELLSADLIMLRDKKTAQMIRENRQKMQMEQMKMEAQSMQAKANQSNAQAAAAQAGAMKTSMEMGYAPQ